MSSSASSVRRTGLSAFEGVPFILGQPAPYPAVLVGVHGPLQTGVKGFAATADDPCPFDLTTCDGGVTDWEEQLGILIEAGRAVAPRHQVGLFESGVGESASSVLGARPQFLADITSDQEGDEGADRGAVELGCHPVQAFVHLTWVEPVGELLADLVSHVLQVRVDLGLTWLGIK